MTSTANQTIGGIIDSLRSGRLVVPSIQRGYVWTLQSVARLLDSIYRGYPVGSLLVWRTSLDMPFRPMPEIAEHVSDVVERSYLIDGQQRMLSIALSMIREDQDDRQRVLFHLLDEEFLVGRHRHHGDRLAEIWELLDSSIPQSEVIARSGIESGTNEWMAASDSIMRARSIYKYLLPVVYMDEDDPEIVADVFIRINKYGRRLTVSDLVYSGAVARWPWLSDAIRDLDRYMEDVLDWPVSVDSMLRLLGVISGAGLRQMDLITGTRVTEERAKDAWESVRVALSHTSRFGKDSGFRWSGQMPPGSVVSVSWALHLNPNIDRDALRRWVYASLVFEDRHLGSTVESECRVLKAYPDIGGVERLLERALSSGERDPAASITPDDVDRMKYPSSRFGPLLQALYLAEGTSDWLTDDQMIDVMNIDQHHIFPKQHVVGLASEGDVNSLANIAFISELSNERIGSRPPAAYLPDIDPHILDQHDVPTRPALWRTDALSEFLQVRRQRLSDRINDALGLPKA